MKKTFLNNWISQNIILCIIIFASCGINDNRTATSDYVSDNRISNLNDFEGTHLDNSILRRDTVTVQTSEELIQQLRSNRLIKLVSSNYILDTSLIIEGINDLQIEGTGYTKLSTLENNLTVLKLSEVNNIHLDGLILGQSESEGVNFKHCVMRISSSNNINISNCKLLGAGTFGLITYDVNELSFNNSEITHCTGLIFELKKSRNIKFKDSRFYSNNSSISVLGAFTNSTREVTFLNCDFVDNIPDMAGNPAFNFLDNYTDLEDKILFDHCTFKNNKGFKWYGEKIELIDCKMDSSGFIGLK